MPSVDLHGSVGRPPRRASLLDVRFTFGSEGASPERGAASADPSADPSAGPSALGADALPPAEPASRQEAVPAAPSPVFVTATMAELYRAQGMPERALEIYRTLSEREPGRPDLAARVRELEAAASAPAPAPASAPVGEPSSAMLAALSFEDVRLPAADPVPDVGADLSARAFFRALGERAVGGTIAHDLVAAAAAIGDAPLQATVALDDAFADWT